MLLFNSHESLLRRQMTWWDCSLLHCIPT